MHGEASDPRVLGIPPPSEPTRPRALLVPALTQPRPLFLSPQSPEPPTPLRPETLTQVSTGQDVAPATDPEEAHNASLTLPLGLTPRLLCLEASDRRVGPSPWFGRRPLTWEGAHEGVGNPRRAEQ